MVRRSRIFLAICAAIPFITYLLIGSEGGSFEKALERDLGKAWQVDAISDGSHEFIQAALDRLYTQFGIDTPVLNPPIHPVGQRSVYLIDFSKIAEYEILDAARLNFIAIPPNTIVIDRDFFEFTTEQYDANLLAFLQDWSERRSFSRPEFDRSNFAKAMLSFGNLSAFYGFFGNEVPRLHGNLERLNTYYVALDGAKSSQQVVDALRRYDDPLHSVLFILIYSEFLEREGLVPADFTAQDLVLDYVKGALGFILLHEQAHLERGVPGGWTLPGIGQSEGAGEEVAADAYAIERLTNAGGASDQLGLDFASDYLARTAFVRVIDQLADFDAQKYGTFIEYKSDACLGSVRGFFDMNLIKTIHPSMLPLLSKDEFDRLSGAASHFHSVSHGSQIVRAQSLGKEVNYAGSIADFLSTDTVEAWNANLQDYVTGLIDRDYRIIGEAIYKSMPQRGATAPQSDVASVRRPFIQGANLERTNVCPPGHRCLVGAMGNKNRIEIVYPPGEGASYFKIASHAIIDPTPQADVLDANSRMHGREDMLREIRAGNFSPEVEWLIQFAREQFSVTKGEFENQLANFFSGIRNCGFASFVSEGDRVTVRGSSLGNLGEFQIEIFR